MTSIGIKFPTDLEQVKPTPEDVLLAANPEGVSRNVQVGELIEAVKENVPLETLVDTVSSQQSTINTMAHTAEGKDATIAQLTANQAAPALEAELAVGKTDLASAITAKGVETAATDSLATMADKVREIVRETTTISGGEFYPQNMLGTAVWNLFEVAAMVKSEYISSGRYAGAIVAQYYKGYATLDLTLYGGGYAACLTSDGDFYANDGEHTPIGVHTWHDDDTGKVDRYVVFLWFEDNYTFQSLSSGVCPRQIVVLGTCASIQVNYNRLVQLYAPIEFGELNNFRLAGSDTPEGNWAAVQIWHNYKEHTAGTIFQNANNLIYVEITNLERLSGGYLFYNTSNAAYNSLNAVSFPSLREISASAPFNLANSNSYSALSIISFNTLELISAKGAIIKNVENKRIINTFNLLKIIDLPKLQRIEDSSLIFCNGSYSINDSLNSVEQINIPKLTEVMGALVKNTSGNGISNVLNNIRELNMPSLRIMTLGITSGGIVASFTNLERISIPAAENVKLFGATSYPALEYIYVGYTDNDRTLTVNLNEATAPLLTDIELKDGYCKNLVCTYSTLTAENIVAHILNRLGVNQAYLDEPTDANKLTITLGATNLAKLTDEEKQIAIDKGFTLA